MILDLTAEHARANAEREGVAPTHTLTELAALIEAVLTHPLLPESVYDGLWNAINELATPESFYNSASYIEGRLRGVEGPVVGPQDA